MNQERIILTEEDFALIAASLEGRAGCRYASFLKDELSRAEVVPEENIASKVVTLNSRLHVLEEELGFVRDLTLVLPENADSETGYESVLSPVGAAVLGLREGTSIEWRCYLSGGRRAFTVKRVLFQPEAENRICIAS